MTSAAVLATSWGTLLSIARAEVQRIQGCARLVVPVRRLALYLVFLLLALALWSSLLALPVLVMLMVI